MLYQRVFQSPHSYNMAWNLNDPTLREVKACFLLDSDMLRTFPLSSADNILFFTKFLPKYATSCYISANAEHQGRRLTHRMTACLFIAKKWQILAKVFFFCSRLKRNCNTLKIITCIYKNTHVPKRFQGFTVIEDKLNANIIKVCKVIDNINNCNLKQQWVSVLMWI